MPEAATKAKQLNVVLIMTDTQGWNMVGAYGDEKLDTPNLNKLAAEGVRFDCAYTTCPLCTPARGGIFTGQHPQVSGPWCNNLAPGQNIPLMGTLFKEHGYRAAYTGKWHLEGGGYFGDGIAGGGFEQEWWYDGHSYAVDIGEEMFKKYAQVRSVEDIRRDGFTEENIWGHRVANRAIDFLKQAGDGPFVLSVSFDEPHGPCVAPAEYWEGVNRDDMTRRPNYFCPLENKPQLQQIQRQENGELPWDTFTRNHSKIIGCTAYIDREIGRVIDAVKRLHGDDTVIMFTSDHGDHAGAHGLFAKGATMYEETTHIPFIVRMPGGTHRGVCASPVSHVDIIPTMLELCGLETKHELHGTSLVPLLDDPGGRVNDDILMSYSAFGKYHAWYGQFYPIRCIMDGRYKLAINLFDSDELYDLQEDPYEMSNLIDSPATAEIRNDLHDRLLDQMKEMGDPFNTVQWANRSWRPNRIKPFFHPKPIVDGK